jgi:hypothetical protein
MSCLVKGCEEEAAGVFCLIHLGWGWDEVDEK